MSLAEEMLASISVDDVIQTYSETEEHIVVNDMRQIIVPNSLKTIAVTGDKDIETVTFDCVRYWDGNDLSTFAIYLNYVLPDMRTGTYIPKEVVTSEGDQYYHFDWEIKDSITQKSGKISFAITAIKSRRTESGTVLLDKKWSSIPNSDCSIALGLNISNVPSEEESEDILSQMSAILEDLQSNLTELVYSNVVQSSGYDTTKVMSQAAVTGEFEKTNQRIEKNDKRITNIEKGMMADSFETDDSVAYIKDVPTNALPYAAISKVGGMTYRYGNALRSAPVTEVNSVGRNLIPYPYYDTTKKENGVTFTDNGDGTITLKGTATGNSRFDFLRNSIAEFPNAIYTLSGISGGSVTTYYMQMFSGEKFYDSVSNGSITVKTDGNLTMITLYVKTGAVFNNLVIKPQLEKGTKATTYTPYVNHTLPIPAEVQALDGYGEGLNGTYYNYVSWNADGSVTFNKVTRKVALTGKEDWALGVTADSVTEYNRYICYDFNSPFVTTKHCSHFDYLGDDVSAYNPTGEGLASGASGASNFVLDFAFRKNGNMPTLDSWKAYLAQQYAAGVPVTVEFLDRYTETTVIDISDLISKDNLIGVEGDGDITMVNEHKYAVPSEIIYQVKGE